jgi:2-C-methyl-D-erythritol 4-phosphate cytidylyltransferase
MKENIKQVIIVAGGKGERMGNEIPKQFIEIKGIPILMLTLKKFYHVDPSIGIILVLPKDQISPWKTLCEHHHFNIPYILVEGGDTRFHSVKNGLEKATKEGLIGVHDGVRPFVADEVINCCYNTAIHAKAVVPVVDVIDTIRQVHPFGESHTVPRNEYKLVQTPQVFDAALLHDAYEQQVYSNKFTDDASVVESAGVNVTLVHGNRENIKITTPFDLKLAEAFNH